VDGGVEVRQVAGDVHGVGNAVEHGEQGFAAAVGLLGAADGRGVLEQAQGRPGPGQGRKRGPQPARVRAVAHGHLAGPGPPRADDLGQQRGEAARNGA
jgi:hypothetical protein